MQFGSHPVSDCGSKMHRVRKGQSVPAKQQMSAMPIRTRSHGEVPVSLRATHVPDQHHCDRATLRRTLAFLATVVEQLTRLTLVQLKQLLPSSLGTSLAMFPAIHSCFELTQKVRAETSK